MEYLDKIWHGDSMELLRAMPDASVDLVLTDPPYGTTNCPWDRVATGPEWWAEIRRVARRGAAVLVFGQEPFSSRMRLASPIPFRYDWIWRKTAPCGFLNANRMPLRAHEVVSVFYDALPSYNPQKTPPPDGSTRVRRYHERGRAGVYAAVKNAKESVYTDRFPTDVITMKPEKHTYAAGRVHPTQKPLALMEYFIRTYTDPGQVVLDPFMGSGTTAVAALRLGRRFAGAEAEAGYHAAILRRLDDEGRSLSSALFRPNDIV